MKGSRLCVHLHFKDRCKLCKIEKPVIGGGTGDSASVPPAAVSKDSASQPSGPSNQVELISGVYAIAYMCDEE